MNRSIVLLLVLSGCGGGVDTTTDPSTGTEFGEELSTLGGPVSISEVMSRAQNWYANRNNMVYDENQYCSISNGGYHCSKDVDALHYYRQDCSGFVSMAWHLNSSRNTSTLLSIMSQVPADDIRQGDAVEKDENGTHHVQLFDHWTDSSKTCWYGYSFGYAPMQYAKYCRTAGSASMISGGGWYAYRYKNITGGGGGNTPPPADNGGGTPTTKHWVDTFQNAPGYSSPGGTHTGTLNQGTNYVFCKKWGPIVQNGADYNHWWMKTDLDSGSPWSGQYVSAYYLSRWGNDVAKDNSGNTLPDCP